MSDSNFFPQETLRPSDNKFVKVPFDYLLSTHIQMQATYDKLKEMLGESQALAVFALSADNDLPAKQPDAQASVEELMRLMAEGGYSLKGEEEEGGSLKFELTCPHAAKIHPHLGMNASYCPMSQMVLSTVRMRYGNSVVTRSKLNRTGSTFTIQVQKK